MKVRFHYDIDNFRLRDSRIIKKSVARLISDFGFKCGNVDVIISTDEKIYEINKEFLGHDYYTDVITFNFNEGNCLNGEIYISGQRVRVNAETYGVTFKSEMRRVIFHGFLHLCGYDDKSEEGKREMTELEDIYLALSFAG